MAEITISDYEVVVTLRNKLEGKDIATNVVPFNDKDKASEFFNSIIVNENE